MNAEPKVLLDAADLIQTGGLYKGAYRGPNGAHCLFGAIAEVDSSGERPGALERLYAPALMKVISVRDAYEVIDWNDQPETSAEQVVRALREAAAQLAIELAGVG